MKLIGATALALLAVAAPASAGHEVLEPGKWVARYCSTTGDICFGIYKRSGHVSFQLTTAAKYFNRHTICVRSPRGRRTCRAMNVVRQGQLWGTSRAWPRNFGDSRPGTYRVTWKQAGRALGPTLRFTHP